MPDSPRNANLWRNTPSAVGERQMLPMQTMMIRVFFCEVICSPQFSEQKARFEQHDTI